MGAVLFFTLRKAGLGYLLYKDNFGGGIAIDGSHIDDDFPVGLVVLPAAISQLLAIEQNFSRTFHAKEFNGVGPLGNHTRIGTLPGMDNKYAAAS